MTESAATAPARARRSWRDASRTRLFVLQAAAGLVAGVLWWVWSPDRPDAWVVGTHRVLGLFTAGTLQPFEEEGWIATDGRYALLMLVLGVAFAVWAWTMREIRGPGTVLVLAVGGLVSSVAAGLIGFLLGGGHITGEVGKQIRTALTVHAYGLYFLQPFLVMLIYGLCVAFARADDLGVAETPIVTAEPSLPS